VRRPRVLVRPRTDSRVVTSMMASPAATSPAVSRCTPGDGEEASAAGPSARQAVRGPLSGTGLGIAEELTAPGGSDKLPEPARAEAEPFRFGAAGTMTGNRPTALPAGTSVTMTRSTADAPRSGAAGGTAANALPAPAELVSEPPEAAVRDAERAERAELALEEGDRAELVRAVGEDDPECVGRVLAVGDAEWVGLALVVGDAEWAGLALAVADAE